MLNKLKDMYGEPSGRRGEHYLWQCPYCKDSGCDNLIYTPSKNLVKCFKDTEHSKKVYGELMKGEKTVVQSSRSCGKTYKKLKATKSNSIINPEFLEYQSKCNTELMNDPKSLAYLEKKRGITPLTVARTGIGIDRAKRAWVFPIYNEFTLLGFEFRDAALTSGKDKKVWKKYTEGGITDCLAQINTRTPDTHTLVIIEGFIDGYLFWQFQGMDAPLFHIMTPSNGVGTIHEHINEINPKNYSKICVFLDNDEAGREELAKIREIVKFDVEFLYLPCQCCKDFGEWYMRHKLDRNN
jgi:hypothetical protein